MLNAFLLLAATTAAASEPPPAPRGVEVLAAEVAVQIVQPAIVRQASGPQLSDREAPAPQITRRGARVLVEYQ